jgi:hypothetical protein
VRCLVVNRVNRMVALRSDLVLNSHGLGACEAVESSGFNHVVLD